MNKLMFICRKKSLPLSLSDFLFFMKTTTILARLLEKSAITPQQSALIETFESRKPFSVHWELRSILFLGVLFFTSGIGILVYQNIDTVGHQAIIALIALITAGCFYHAFRHRVPFSWQETESVNKLSEYTLLLGCTSFLILEGYLQFQYNLFGNKYGLAAVIPTILFFFCAYFWDHRGVLSMAITGLASWLGLTIAPLSLLSGNDFTDVRLLNTSIMLGMSLILFGWVCTQQNRKAHFSNTYFFLGGNLASVAALTGMFNQDSKIMYFISAALLSGFFIYFSRQKQALIFLLMGVVYGYITLTYALFRTMPDSLLAAIGVYYFLLSSAGVILFLLNVKKILGAKNDTGL